jgi:mono/diheme cytochrome c family protein
VQNAAGNLVGGDLGPELTRVGSKLKPEWLQAWLRDPRSYNAHTLMPHYRWTDQQLKVLIGYVENKTDPDFLANVHLEPATLAANRARKSSGHRIRMRCLPRDPRNPEAGELCARTKPHRQQASRAAGLPPRHATKALPDYLAGKDPPPRAFGAALRMPQYTFTSDQTDALTTALLSLTDRSFTLPSRLQIPSAPTSTCQPAGHAGKLMTELNCFACHRIDGRGGDMAPDLTWEGSVVQRPWFDDFLKNPNTLRPALIRRMPKFNLSDSERAGLTDYFMTVYQTADIDRDSMPLSGYSPATRRAGPPALLFEVFLPVMPHGEPGSRTKATSDLH